MQFNYNANYYSHDILLLLPSFLLYLPHNILESIPSFLLCEIHNKFSFLLCEIHDILFVFHGEKSGRWSDKILEIVEIVEIVADQSQTFIGDKK